MVANALSVSPYSLVELAHQNSDSCGEVCCMGGKRDWKSLIDAAADAMEVILREVSAC